VRVLVGDDGKRLRESLSSAFAQNAEKDENKQ
jgi:hypothetical protein